MTLKDPGDLPPTPSLKALTDQYDGILIDAYGVLVDKSGALPGAAEFLARLDTEGVPWLVVTNSASRLPETLAAELAALGVPVPAGRLVTSGGLLPEHFAERGLDGCRCVVMGPAESIVYVERAGGIAVMLDDHTDADALVIADQKDVRCLEDLDRAVSLMLRRFDAGKRLELLLCNPDLLYPVAPGRFGFTAGGLAAMLEAVLRERYPRRDLGFLRLGKPNRPIFDAALRRLGSARAVMIGDQLGTDIAGAVGCGLDSVLVGTGVAPAPGEPWPVRPTWYLRSLTQMLDAGA
jgi:HAD superfamily hydrolase (TIGR01450 family)